MTIGSAVLLYGCTFDAAPITLDAGAAITFTPPDAAAPARQSNGLGCVVCPFGAVPHAEGALGCPSCVEPADGGAL